MVNLFALKFCSPKFGSQKLLAQIFLSVGTQRGKCINVQLWTTKKLAEARSAYIVLRHWMVHHICDHFRRCACTAFYFAWLIPRPRSAKFSYYWQGTI
jgi:hypothetical protein